MTLFIIVGVVGYSLIAIVIYVLCYAFDDKVYNNEYCPKDETTMASIAALWPLVLVFTPIILIIVGMGKGVDKLAERVKKEVNQDK